MPTIVAPVGSVVALPVALARAVAELGATGRCTRAGLALALRGEVGAATPVVVLAAGTAIDEADVLVLVRGAAWATFDADTA